MPILCLDFSIHDRTQEALICHSYSTSQFDMLFAVTCKYDTKNRSDTYNECSWMINNLDQVWS